MAQLLKRPGRCWHRESWLHLGPIPLYQSTSWLSVKHCVIGLESDQFMFTSFYNLSLQNIPYTWSATAVREIAGMKVTAAQLVTGMMESKMVNYHGSP